MCAGVDLLSAQSRPPTTKRLDIERCGSHAIFRHLPEIAASWYGVPPSAVDGQEATEAIRAAFAGRNGSIMTGLDSALRQWLGKHGHKTKRPAELARYVMVEAKLQAKKDPPALAVVPAVVEPPKGATQPEAIPADTPPRRATPPIDEDEYFDQQFQAMNKGYYQLARSWEQLEFHPSRRRRKGGQKYTPYEALCELLRIAVWTEDEAKPVLLRDGTIIHLERGQVMGSRRKWAKTFGWDKNRKTLDTMLQVAERAGVLTVSRGGHFTVITFHNPELGAPVGGPPQGATFWPTTPILGATPGGHHTPSDTTDYLGSGGHPRGPHRGPHRGPPKGAHLKNSSRTQEQKNTQSVKSAFQALLETYPKRPGKLDLKAARAAWSKLNPDPELIGVIDKDVKARAQSKRWQDQKGRFVPKLQNYIGNEEWTEPAPPHHGRPRERD